MKIIVHDLFKNTQYAYEGDAASVERRIEEDFPWAVSGNEGDLEHILWTLDHSQMLAVEVVDPSLHPFLKE